MKNVSSINNLFLKAGSMLFMWVFPYIARAESIVNIDGVKTQLSNPETKQATASILNIVAGIIGILIIIGIYVAIITFMTSSSSFPVREKSRNLFKLAGLGALMVIGLFFLTTWLTR